MSGVAVGRAFLLEPFADYLSLEAGSSPNTVEGYLRDIRRLGAFAVSRHHRSPDRVKPETVRDLVYHLKDLGFSTSSIRRQIAAIRTYYRFLIGEGDAAVDPGERLAELRSVLTLVGGRAVHRA